MPHMHLSAVDALKVILIVIVFAYVWRTLAARNADRPIGQAMAHIL